MSVELLTVSSKGQVVLPSKIRRELSITTGSKLAAYAVGDVIMLKPVNIPKEEDFKYMLAEAQEWAESVGYVAEDVEGIIKEVRQRKR